MIKKSDEIYDGQKITKMTIVKKNVLDPAKFGCKRCGECCRPIVKLSEEDIKRIEQAGYKKKDFLDYDPCLNNPKKKDILKRPNNICMFLKREETESEGKASEYIANENKASEDKVNKNKVSEEGVNENRGSESKASEDGVTFICKIYDYRPEICRKYPFLEPNMKVADCRPKYFQKLKSLKEELDQFK